MRSDTVRLGEPDRNHRLAHAAQGPPASNVRRAWAVASVKILAPRIGLWTNRPVPEQLRCLTISNPTRCPPRVSGLGLVLATSLTLAGCAPRSRPTSPPAPPNDPTSAPYAPYSLPPATASPPPVAFPSRAERPPSPIPPDAGYCSAQYQSQFGWPDPDKAARVCKCESGGNPRAVSRNGRYAGLFQFARDSWEQSGKGDVLDPYTNSLRAFELWRRRGWRPWPHCSRD